MDWLARTAGSSSGAARSALETASAVEGCTSTAEALVAGELSLEQAAVITKTVSECAGTEAELLDLARRSSLATLRDEARKRRLEAVDPEELHHRQHRARCWPHPQAKTERDREAGLLVGAGGGVSHRDPSRPLALVSLARARPR